jgi:hypothetical protein
MAAPVAQRFTLDKSYFALTPQGQILGWNEKAIQLLGQKLKKGDIIDLSHLEITAQRISELIQLLQGRTAYNLVHIDVSQFSNKFTLPALFRDVTHSPSIHISGYEASCKNRLTLTVNYQPLGPQAREFPVLLSSPSPIPPSPMPSASPTQHQVEQKTQTTTPVLNSDTEKKLTISASCTSLENEVNKKQ